MPQNGAQSSAQSPVSLPIDLSGLRRLVESLTAVYPSVYRGGFVHLEQVDKPSILLASIVCQTEYSHLSPEVSYCTGTRYIPRILKATCVGIAIPGSEHKLKSRALGAFVRGEFNISTIILSTV